MTPFQTMIRGMTVDTLDGFDRDAAIEAGFAPTKAHAWEKLHRTYFGPTKFTKLQRIAREKARAGKFSLDQLAMIEERLKNIESPKRRMVVRLSLLDARLTYAALQRLASKLIPKKSQPPKRQMTFSKSRNGTRTVSITADERDAADLEHAVSQDLDPSQPAAPQMLENFLALMRGNGEHAGAGVPYADPRPIVVVPVEEHCKILGGHGDDTLLGLTDGTTMTGAEYLQTRAGQYGLGLEVGLFHPQEGAVNLYREERFANQKQRDLARLTTPVCPVPDCRHGADSCQIHHITAWKHGGETNLANLAPLCRYHNGVNDDDPKRKKRGRIENVGGIPTWVSPRGFHVPNSHHPFGAMQLLFSDRL